MIRFFTNRWVHIAILAGLLAGAVIVRMHDYGWSKSLRYLAFDAYSRMDPRLPTDEAVIVDIDEASLGREELGQWPWSRDVVAKLVENLSAMGAKAIVFDMVFAEEDRTSPRAISARLAEGEKSPEMEQVLSSLPDHDELFAQAIRNSGRAVTAFIWTEKRESTRRKPVLSQPVLVAKNARPLMDSVPGMTGVTTNLPVLAQAAAGNGSFGVSPEIDGIIRRVPLLFAFREEGGASALYPSLAVEAVRVSQGAKTLNKVRALKPGEAGIFDPPLKMSIGAYEVPLDWDGQFYIYFSKARPEKYVPAWKVIDGSADPDRIRDKVVFVGTSAEGLKDIRSTPQNLFIPGVEVHVNVVEQILSGKFLVRPALLNGMELDVIVVVGLMIIGFAPFVGALVMAAFILALIAAFGFVSWYGFETYGLLLDPVYPGLSLLSLFVISSLLTYIRSEAERRQVRQAFGLYISPDFMEELTKNPEKLKLGGETRELTVMFTDIRNFTTISESMSPEALIQVMNGFLTPMSDLVMENRGTIDKYMGDAMMAFWNAPLDDPDHAIHACRAAVRMNEALVPVNEEIRVRAQAERRQPVLLKAGIGINTGPASVGNMGSRQRFAYSAMGDTVNLASRLEGQTKPYGVSILVSDAVRLKVPGFAALELDLLQVKGKTEPVRIHTLLGEEEKAQDPAFLRWQEAHGEMMGLYRAAAFDAALAAAGRCRELSGGEIAGFYDMFEDRLREMKAAPPPEGWDGVYVATSK